MMSFCAGDIVWVMFVRPMRAKVVKIGYFPEMRYVVDYGDGHTGEPIPERVFGSELAAWESERDKIKTKLDQVDAEITRILGTKEAKA
jgi:hypothetical protein